MAFRLTPAEHEALWMNDNSFGVVDVHRKHVKRVAEILAESFPGMVLLWGDEDRNRQVTLCAVRPDGRRAAEKLEARMVAAGEKIAANVAAKHPVQSGCLAWFIPRRSPKAGYCYEPPK